MTATIQIEIDVQENTLICGRNGGSTRGYPGSRITWRSRRAELPFTLEFFRLGLETDGQLDVSQLQRWPFTEEPPRGAVVGPTTEFSATLRRHERPDGREELAAYEYFLAVRNLRLDPIIIVDKT